jgi:hypothetical protein
MLGRYSTGRPSQKPLAPIQLPSTAALVVSGVPLVLPICDGANKLPLRAADADSQQLTLTLTSLPTGGTLTDAVSGLAQSVGDSFTITHAEHGSPNSTILNLEIVYTPTAFLLWTSDTFNYSVSDGGAPSFATVHLIRHTLPTPTDMQFTFDEDTLSYIALSKPSVSAVSKRTTNLLVVITSLPSHGTLYQSCFRADSDQSYSGVCEASTIPTVGVQISAANSTVTSSRGIVLYAPLANEFGQSYTTFGFRFVDPEDASIFSDEATVTISIRSQNDAPIAHANIGTAPFLSSSNPAQPLTFILASSDVDEDETNPRAYAPSFAPHSFARITRFPSSGRLYQVGANGSLGAVLDGTVAVLPTVSSWVTEVVRYSSQYTRCRGCYSWSGAEQTGCNQLNPASSSTCVGPTCAVPYADSLTWGDSSCTETAWHANQIVGPPDFYPGYGDTPLGWDLSAENSGREFIELRFGASMCVNHRRSALCDPRCLAPEELDEAPGHVRVTKRPSRLPCPF